MTLQFWIGLLAGGAIVYVIMDFFKGMRGVSETANSLRCAIEVARANAHLDLNSYSDEELIRAIASGAKSLPRRDDKPGEIHPPVRSGPEGS